jgi:hypothetical protein
MVRKVDPTTSTDYPTIPIKSQPDHVKSQSDHVKSKPDHANADPTIPIKKYQKGLASF